MGVSTSQSQPLPLSTEAGAASAPMSEPGASSLGDGVMDFLGCRFSVGPKYLVHPAPTDTELRRAACLALRAPDHGGLQPFRFVQVAAHQRDHLGGLFAQDATRRGRGADEVERARRRAHNGPALVALVGSVRPGVDDVPVDEQWLCIGAGLMNFLNALHLMGYGAKTLSGASIRAPEIQQAFCAPGEVLLAWIVIGTPTRAMHAKRLDDATRALTTWAP